MRYWLMKTEPDVFSIDDLKSQKTTPWEGVRNYQARNFMRDEMKKGDLVLIYHSNAKPPGVAGVGVVSKEAFPDHFAWDKKSKYYDPKSPKENPRWMMVEIRFKKKFKEILSLAELKETKGLEDMLILRKGNRLSITPVEKKHYEQIIGMR
tara:strand:+ start:12697 stop:13149 length:453 start_codon:yes stop_codon:yes gene_type:complete